MKFVPAGAAVTFSSKSALQAKWVGVMDRARADRNLILSPYTTRCIRTGEIHEFLSCCNVDPSSNFPIQEVGYLGFAEFTVGGVMAVGDVLSTQNHKLGTIVGFEETHMPNHQNTLLATDTIVTGSSLCLRAGEKFIIEQIGHNYEIS